MALLEVLVPLVTKQLCAEPKISEERRWAWESGEWPSGSERSPSDSTETERSVRKIMEEKASWKPWRKGERSKALPLLWPGGVPEARQPEGREEVAQAFAVTHGIGQHGEGFLRPAAAGQVELGVARARDEHLGDGGEVGQEPRGNGEAVDGVVEEGAPAPLDVQQKEAAPAPGLGEDVAIVLRAKERGVQFLRRAHGHQPQPGIVQRVLKGEMLAAKGLKEVGKTVLQLLQEVRRRLGRVREIKDSLRLHTCPRSKRSKKRAHAPKHGVAGHFDDAHRGYSATMASIGQAPAQVPQLTHFSASMT